MCKEKAMLEKQLNSFHFKHLYSASSSGATRRLNSDHHQLLPLHRNGSQQTFQIDWNCCSSSSLHFQMPRAKDSLENKEYHTMVSRSLKPTKHETESLEKPLIDRFRDSETHPTHLSTGIHLLRVSCSSFSLV